MTISLICIGLAATLAIVIKNTRGARLKRLAETLHLRYDNDLNDVLTEESKQASLFFQQGMHRFYHVLTSSEPGAFIRICDDRMLSSKNPYAPRLAYTLVTAELTRGTFTPLILMPRRAGQTDAPHPSLPASLAQKYMLSAPDTYQLPDTVLGFLQTAKPCYLELTPTSLIYHEFENKSISEIQPLRFRVKQLLNALVHKPEPIQVSDPAQTFTYTQTFQMPAQTFTNYPTQTFNAPTQTFTSYPTQTFTYPMQNTVSPTQANTSPLSQAAVEASVIMKLQSAQQSSLFSAGKGVSSGKWVFGIIFILMMLGMCLFASYALRNWVPH